MPIAGNYGFGGLSIDAQKPGAVMVVSLKQQYVLSFHDLRETHFVPDAHRGLGHHAQHHSFMRLEGCQGHCYFGSRFTAPGCTPRYCV